MVSIEQEGFECIEELIKDMIKEYEAMAEYYDTDGYVKQGAISALEELLRRLNEE